MTVRRDTGPVRSTQDMNVTIPPLAGINRFTPGATEHSVNFETKAHPSRNCGVRYPMPGDQPCPVGSKIGRSV